MKRAIRHVFLALFLIFASGAVLLPASSAAACEEAMEEVTPEEDAVYVAQWHVEKREYRSAIKVLMKQFPSLQEELAAMEEMKTERAYILAQAASVASKATIRSGGKYAMTKKAKKISKKKREGQLKWALRTLEKLGKLDAPDLYEVTVIEAKLALDGDTKVLFERLKAIDADGGVGESVVLEKLAALGRTHGEKAVAKSALARAKDARDDERDFEKPDFVVMETEVKPQTKKSATAKLAPIL